MNRVTVLVFSSCNVIITCLKITKCKSYVQQTFLEMQELVFASLIIFVVVTEFIHVQHVNQRRLLSQKNPFNICQQLSFVIIDTVSSYPLKQLESTNQRPDLAPVEEGLP